jgi:small GTP-binding protein
MTKSNVIQYPNFSLSQKSIKKIAILGDAAVGKTSLAERFINKKFDDSYNITIAGNFLKKIIPTEKGKEILIISDIAGQSRFEEVRSAFFLGAEVVLAVCDLTRKKTLENLENIWIPEFLIANPIKGRKKTKIQLIGNKCDLEDLMVMDMSDLEKIALSIARKYPRVTMLMPCLLTSAKEDLLIEEAFGSKKKLTQSRFVF